MGIVGQPFHGIPSQTHEYIEWYLANLIPFLNMQGPQVTVDIGVSNTSVETHQMKSQQRARRRRTPPILASCSIKILSHLIIHLHSLYFNNNHSQILTIVHTHLYQLLKNLLPICLVQTLECQSQLIHTCKICTPLNTHHIILMMLAILLACNI